MSPGSTVQAFPKCFCALPGITQLTAWGFSSGKYLRLLRPMSSYLISGDFTVPTLPSRAACSAPINNLFLLQSASFLSLCGYAILTSQSKLNAIWVLLRSPVVQCLSRVMTARLCQGHCNVFFSVLAWVSFRQHNFCSEMKYKKNVANRMMIKKKTKTKTTFIQVNVHIQVNVLMTPLNCSFCVVLRTLHTLHHLKSAFLWGIIPYHWIFFWSVTIGSLAGVGSMDTPHRRRSSLWSLKNFSIGVYRLTWSLQMLPQLVEISHFKAHLVCLEKHFKIEQIITYSSLTTLKNEPRVWMWSSVRWHHDTSLKLPSTFKSNLISILLPQQIGLACCSICRWW